MANLHEGDSAPDFSGIDQDGKPIHLSDFKGKKLILYFYPKDNTPGCIAEACSLRDGYDELFSKGYDVVGVSADSEKSHQGFIQKNNLPFRLISDPDKRIIQDYGAWGQKKLYGKIFEGIIRTTYVISEEGRIERIIDNVKTKDHANQVLLG
jgi:peroxiredoxin Q/BCP